MCKEVGLLLLLAAMLQYLTVEMTVNNLQLQIIMNKNISFKILIQYINSET
jgi:hypothetical protein